MRNALIMFLVIGLSGLLLGGCQNRPGWMGGKKNSAPPPPPIESTTSAAVIEPTAPPQPEPVMVEPEPIVVMPEPVVRQPVVQPEPVVAPVPAPAEQIHVVVKDDSLWKIAQRYYGKGTMWRVIADANGITDPKRLRIGQKLVIPAQ